MGRGQSAVERVESQALLFGRRRAGKRPLPPVRVRLSADALWNKYQHELTCVISDLLDVERNPGHFTVKGKPIAEQAAKEATEQLNELAELAGLSGIFTVSAEGPHPRNRQLRDVKVTWHGMEGSVLTAITPGFGPRDLAEELVSLHQA